MSLGVKRRREEKKRGEDRKGKRTRIVFWILGNVFLGTIRKIGLRKVIFGILLDSLDALLVFGPG